MTGRSKKRADGSLRPTAARRRKRLRAAKEEKRRQELDSTPERQEWLAQFSPGARDRFFATTQWWSPRTIWLGAFHTQLLKADPTITELAASLALEQEGYKRHWAKLRKADGFVVGIAPLINYARDASDEAFMQRAETGVAPDDGSA